MRNWGAIDRLSASLPSLASSSPPLAIDIADDRATLQPDDRVLLIIEDDLKFARILLDIARQQGFKGLIAARSDVGLMMVQEFHPKAIMLDIRLPGMDGWTVLERLKHDPSTCDIPVQIMSVEEGQQRSLQMGAIAFLQKPISREMLLNALASVRAFVDRSVKNLLVVEDDDIQRQSLMELLNSSNINVMAVETGGAALETLKSAQFDCIVLDLILPDMTGGELIEQIKQDEALVDLPIIIYTGKELELQEESELRQLSDTIILKDARSPERLLAETTLFLHRVQANLLEPPTDMLPIDPPPLDLPPLDPLERSQSNEILVGKKVLIVDDDVRNIFALTSLLEQYQMQVIYAENGRDGMAQLQNDLDIALVLMDLMMPEMDGYETMQTIRQIEQFRSLPMIALTAKAMKGDREKCLSAGASDYITKPVDVEQLLSLLRLYLSQPLPQ